MLRTGCRPEQNGGAVALAVLTVCWLGLVLVRATGPTDLADNAQHRQAAYVADLFYNGAWLYQRDVDGSFQSKPPLYNWLAGAVAVLLGRLDELTLYAPCALACLATAMVTFLACRRYGLSDQVALLAALAVFASPLGVKLAWLARTDTLFACLTWCTALAGLAASSGRATWWGFWLLAALATLTKGPLAVLFAGVGCTLFVWLERQHVRLTRRGLLGGFLLYAAVCLGWFVPAVLAAGPGLAQKLLGEELVQHALFGVERRVPFYGFYKPPLSFLARFLPWSIAAVAVLIAWRRRPPENAFVRFCAYYAFGGLALLMVSPHHRADHLAPLLPAAAVVAAWHLAEGPLRRRQRQGLALALAVVLCWAVAWLHYHLIRPHQPGVQRSVQLQRIARWGRQQRPDAQVIPFRAGGAYHFYAGYHRSDVDLRPLLEALGSGHEVYVVTLSPEALMRELRWVDPSGITAALLDEPNVGARPAHGVHVLRLRSPDAYAGTPSGPTGSTKLSFRRWRKRR